MNITQPVLIGVTALVSLGLGAVGALNLAPDPQPVVHTVVKTKTVTVPEVPDSCVKAIKAGAKTIDTANGLFTDIGDGLSSMNLDGLTVTLTEKTPGYHSDQDEFVDAAGQCMDAANAE